MRRIAIFSSILLFLSAGGLSGCGFTPMHAPSALSSNGATPLQQIKLNMQDGRDATDKEIGFYLQQRLKDRMGSGDSIYTLTVTPDWRRGRLGISADDIASRYDGTVTAKYELVETKTGKTLDTGSISAVTTFGASQDAYGVIASNDNAMRTGAAEAADRLIVKLAGYFANAKNETAP